MGPTGTIRDGVASVYHFLPGTLLLVTAFGGVFDDTNRFVSEVDMGDLVLYVGPYLPDSDWGLVCTPDGCFGRMYLGPASFSYVVVVSPVGPMYTPWRSSRGDDLHDVSGRN